MDPVAAIFVAIAVLGLTILLFSGWLIASVGKAFRKALLPPAASAGQGEPAARPGFMRCRRTNCRAETPESARFCRRCGQVLRDA
jgi:hypothetical protein